MTDIPTDLTPAVVRGHALDVLRSLPDHCVQAFVTSTPYWGKRAYDACSCSVQRNIGAGHAELGHNHSPGAAGGIDPDDPRCRKDPDPACPVCHGTGKVPGVNEQVWGGDRACEHEWGDQIRIRPWAGGNRGVPPEAVRIGRGQSAGIWDRGRYCQKCDAWKGQYGQEPTPYEFVAHTLEWTDEAARVLAVEGSLWLNIDDSSVGSGRGPTGKTGLMNHSNRQGGDENTNGPQFRGDSVMRPKSLALIPERIVIGLQEHGWIIRDKPVWAKPNPGRSSARDRLARAWEPIYRATRSPDAYWDEAAGRQPYALSTLREIGVAYRNPSTKLYERSGAQDPGDVKRSIIKRLEDRGGSTCPDVWSFPPANHKGKHTATFPEMLPRMCIVLSSRPGDLVVDPFAGSGTTLRVARELGRRSLGIEISSEYEEEIRERTDRAHPTIDSFPEAA